MRAKTKDGPNATITPADLANVGNLNRMAREIAELRKENAELREQVEDLRRELECVDYLAGRAPVAEPRPRKCACDTDPLGMEFCSWCRP